ncbi:MAG: methanethiol S-methyltransferase [Pseudomonadales bacterium]
MTQAIHCRPSPRTSAPRVEQVEKHSISGRIFGFLYGVICYTAGMASLVYAALWVGNFWLPTTLDSAPTMPFAHALLINLGLLGLFSLQHSGMARPAFKQRWTKIIPASVERSTYVLTSAVAIVVMMYFWQPLGISIWEIENVTLKTLVYALYAVGWGLLVTSTFWLNHFDLFGLRQVWLNLRGKPYVHLPFKTPALYNKIRHPLYVGWLTLMWATPTMTVSHFVFAAGSTIYILLAITWEERDLVNCLPEYRDYQQRVPKLVPRFMRKTTDAATIQTA